ncbi:phage gene 29 protein family protein [Nocardia wallacei]|uniref:phage gene 29 protein family protein n=1 Tax=Nocardia wallacei TaxID=480035 RepID=UPI002458E4B8|nr:DUF2744 domain-containing protein [Nocardia wallacei]
MAILNRPCKVCGTRRCPCVYCHTECGLDHSPWLPVDTFPTVDNCNPNNPDECFLPFLMGLPGMKGASMAIPIVGMKMWSRRLWDGGGRRVVDPVTFYWPPRAGEINPMFASGEWKDEPPPADWVPEVDINKLSGVLQAEIKRQFDERGGDQQAPPAMAAPQQFVEHITRFDPRHHTVTEVLAHLRTATPGEVDRVFRLEENGSKRAGILKRRKNFPRVTS